MRKLNNGFGGITTSTCVTKNNLISMENFIDEVIELNLHKYNLHIEELPKNENIEKKGFDSLMNLNTLENIYWEFRKKNKQELFFEYLKVVSKNVKIEIWTNRKYHCMFYEKVNYLDGAYKLRSNSHSHILFQHIPQKIDCLTDIIGRKLLSDNEIVKDYNVNMKSNYIVLAPLAVYQLIIQPLIFNLNAYNVLSNTTSLKIESIGKKICSSLISLYDDNTIENSLCKFHFDGFGINAKNKICLIENGILKNLLSDVEVSTILKIKNHNHGGFDENNLFNVKESNIIMHNGCRRIEKLGYREYVMIERFSGMVDKCNGNFEGNARHAYNYVDNISCEIRGLMIKGNSFKLLQNIIEVSYETEYIGNFKLPYLLVKWGDICE